MTEKLFTGGGGAVVQSIVSLTSLLRGQLVKYMPTKLSNTLLFFVEKITFVIFTLENLTKH